MAAKSEASSKRRRADKLADALTASSVIALIGTMEISSSTTKASLLFFAPWFALAGNTILAIGGVFVSGYARLYIARSFTTVLRNAFEEVLRDEKATEDDKKEARATLDRLSKERLVILDDMHRRLSELLGR
jgi:hypothetical protein